jgi:UDP-N-acetylmuramyl-tripeptide synthetase
MLEKILRFLERYVVPKFLYRLGQPIYHFLLAFLGDVIYRFPSKGLIVIGVTGTKGKSTVLEIMKAILERAGEKTALFSSVRRKIGDKSEPNLYDNTMPGRFTLQCFFAEAKKAGCKYVLIEVTSEGVVKHRHRFIRWDGAMFLNLMPEHIEAHGSFEKYREAKLDFFRYAVRSPKSKILFFINRADPNVSYFEKVAKESRCGLIMFFSAEEFKKSDTHDRLKNEWLKTDFNLENTAAAVAFGRSQGISESVIGKALEDFKGLPGRFEFAQKEPFAVVVDYAHTPDSLEKVYKNLNNIGYQNLICVFGSAGGGRDRWKRPAMGKIAAQYCKEIILTNEDPYDENPSQILDEIEKGISTRLPSALSQVNGGQANQFIQHKSASKILDRKEAIKKAISLARGGDVVIMTGKGSEHWIHLEKGKRISWNERETVEEILKNKA